MDVCLAIYTSCGPWVSDSLILCGGFSDCGHSLSLNLRILNLRIVDIYNVITKYKVWYCGNLMVMDGNVHENPLIPNMKDIAIFSSKCPLFS